MHYSFFVTLPPCEVEQKLPTPLFLGKSHAAACYLTMSPESTYPKPPHTTQCSHLIFTLTHLLCPRASDILLGPWQFSIMPFSLSTSHLEEKYLCLRPSRNLDHLFLSTLVLHCKRYRSCTHRTGDATKSFR